MKHRVGKKVVHEHLEFGGTIIVPRRYRIFNLGCCDCGLCHTIKASVNKKGEISLQFYRNMRVTGQHRRRHKKAIVETLVRELGRIKW